MEMAVGIVIDGGKVLIQKRPATGLMAHLWEFPGGRLKPGETPEGALIRAFLEELDLRVAPLSKLDPIRHGYTSFRVTLHPFLCRLNGEAQVPVVRSATAIRWVWPHELGGYPFPAANRKLIRLLDGLEGLHR